MFFNEQIHTAERRRMTVIIGSRLLAGFRKIRRKNLQKQEALEEQKSRSSGKFAGDSTENLLTRQKKMDNIQSSIEECTQAVEDSVRMRSVEILNSRANTKGKAQRFDAMKEQLDIRKAGISQKILSLKTQEEEQQSAIEIRHRRNTTLSRRPFRKP